MDWSSASDLWALIVSKKNKFTHVMQQPQYRDFKGFLIQLEKKKSREVHKSKIGRKYSIGINTQILVSWRES